MEIKLQCYISQIALNLQNLLSSKMISKSIEQYWFFETRINLLT